MPEKNKKQSLVKGKENKVNNIKQKNSNFNNNHNKSKNQNINSKNNLEIEISKNEIFT